MTHQKTHRDDVAQQAISRFLSDVVSHGTYLEGLFHDFSTPNPPRAYYMAHTNDSLDIVELQELLELNDDAVVEWVNQLPEVIETLGPHGLHVIRADTFFGHDCLDRAMVAFKNPE